MLLALTWLNTPWGATYVHTWNTPLTIALGGLAISKPLFFWINQVLMAVFFFVLGLELKRMFRVGELATFRDAAFPVAAALGGMVVPAGLYLYLNPGDTQLGWIIPMATDVAAILALVTLAGNLSLSLRVFLSSVAILQTIVALLLSIVLVSVIGNLLMLSVATGIFGFLIVLRALRSRSMWFYLLLGLVMLGAFLLAGINGTIAGVLFAMVIPVHSRVPEAEFIATADTVMGQLHALHMVKKPEPGEEMEEDYQAAVHTLQANCNKALSPLRKLQHRLLPWAGYLALPLFALAQAPFAYNNFEWRDLLGTQSIGIFLALVVGKPIGMLLFSWLSTLVRFAPKPLNLSWTQITGAALLTGMGFMMSLFVGQMLVVDEGQWVLVKISIYLASAVAGLTGVLLLSLTGKTKEHLNNNG
ncbi:Na+/H+ antiporter NhaA [Pontibacter sp. JH31]|uniref:Na(+)/H(+) antiporter NhaA n=2 Tax=Pontibacter aquaedesilientis TaxID=2766980 RepID=A0ABR7XCQ2_9BACT|nr:Na+/H+ antiporter NhaA [Pontibacter aquaedesilientis]